MQAFSLAYKLIIRGDNAMNNEEINIPSTEEVKKLIEAVMNDKIIHINSIGELLGMKWIDSFLPKLNIDPKWGYEGLRYFFIDHGIESSDSFESALKKL